METARRLDIGCGKVCRAGYEPWDAKDGRDARRLDGIANGQLDSIHASHVLEHVSFRETVSVLQEWARALRIGGSCEIAVPDFDRIVASYAEGNPQIETVLMGAHSDQHDQHHAIFNRQKLIELAAMAGMDYVEDFPGVPGTCSANPLSMNLRFIKRGRRRFPLRAMPDVHAVMTLPRLAWTENINCTFRALGPLGIPFVRATGVFWGQCLQRLMSDVIADPKIQYVLTLDFDSIYDAHDVVALRNVIDETGLDALCALQIGRDRDSIIGNLDDGSGGPTKEIPSSRLADLHWPVLFGHFGLTLIRAESLRKLEKPWFLGQPTPDGEWNDGRVDDDVYFWRKARAAGWRVSTTPQVRVGHLQMVATWPGLDLSPIHQYLPDYHKEGPPQWMLPPA